MNDSNHWGMLGSPWGCWGCCCWRFHQRCLHLVHLLFQVCCWGVFVGVFVGGVVVGARSRALGPHDATATYIYPCIHPYIHVSSCTTALTEGLTSGASVWDNGEWWMLLAAQSMAVGTVLIPWVCRYVDPVVATGWHLILGGIPLAALSAWQELPQLQERLPLLTGRGGG